jgi:hypothetical protein
MKLTYRFAQLYYNSESFANMRQHTSGTVPLGTVPLGTVPLGTRDCPFRDCPYLGGAYRARCSCGTVHGAALGTVP